MRPEDVRQSFDGELGPNSKKFRKLQAVLKNKIAQSKKSFAKQNHTHIHKTSQEWMTRPGSMANSMANLHTAGDQTPVRFKQSTTPTTANKKRSP